MPLIKRLTDDFICDLSWSDIGINPVNCKGVMGAGLALAFKDYCPEMYKSYREMCIEEKLVMGKLHTFHNQEDDTLIINLPTKWHWADRSDINDIELGVQTLVKYLEQYPFKTVLLPMLGAGLGKLDHSSVYALFEKYLDPLPNIIFVCMRPNAIPNHPKYLVVVGSRKFLDSIEIERHIKSVLENDFKLSFSDFEAGVIGGAKGVDTIASNIFKQHHVKSIVCHADWDRYGKTAGFVQNKTLLEVGTHFIIFIGSHSMGSRMMKDLVDKHNRKADELFHKECVLDNIKDFTFNLPPTKEKKKLFIVDISKISE